MKKKELKEIKQNNGNYIPEEDRKKIELKYPKIREKMVMKFAKTTIRIDDPQVSTFFEE